MGDCPPCDIPSGQRQPVATTTRRSGSSSSICTLAGANRPFVCFRVATGTVRLVACDYMHTWSRCSIVSDAQRFDRAWSSLSFAGSGGARTGTRRRRHGARHGEGPDRRRDGRGDGRHQQSRERPQAQRDDRRGREVRLPQSAAESAITSSVAAQGFQNRASATSTSEAAVPIDLDLSLKLAGATRSVEVVGHAEDLLERDPTAHTDIDQSLIDKLPLESSRPGLNQVITLASPGVVADSNGFFHPIGDHAQTQFSIDNQPVTDQQSRLYSNQISPDAVQSMEIITGVAPAEYGDKSSLVVHIVTKSGLDQPKPTGSVSLGYGSFKQPDRRDSISARGTHTVGDFLSVSGMRTDRFLDPPEFEALHDTGKQRVVLQPARFPPDRHRFTPPEPAGREVGIRRAEHARSDRADAAPEHHDVQRRARLLARDRLEDAVHGERIRPAGSPHLPAERRSVRRHAGDRQPGSQADEHGRQGRCRRTRPGTTT